MSCEHVVEFILLPCEVFQFGVVYKDALADPVERQALSFECTGRVRSHNRKARKGCNPATGTHSLFERRRLLVAAEAIHCSKFTALFSKAEDGVTGFSRGWHEWENDFDC